MIKVAVVVLADTETYGDMARVHNALEAAKEFKEAKDDFRLIFDGAGTKWINELSKPEHKLHELFESVMDKKFTGVCSFCSDFFGATESTQAAGIPLMSEFEEHPSFRKLISQGYQIITF
ncbi:hypothetical protein ANME2D_02517 [Candidatus Methanoperedens nitroreducens]|uniref:Uncharacterized protein n=1 Tax=Candidatus Methanoperedens nitratireducens TaxID=1392998 RepID=A0A062UZD2_9EURY|nr:DsrE family protein [Candidatus Methanoperedens nitroreducens]KCZ70497.1 hypothetical protein ANME2D_02517 [Candidatus Methanoperedens nitroreducens]MDJ1420348.1 DsrE family protein [Candidatus Methanoperedens sp.]